jgi:hypothetical protein
MKKITITLALVPFLALARGGGNDGGGNTGITNLADFAREATEHAFRQMKSIDAPQALNLVKDVYTELTSPTDASVSIGLNGELKELNYSCKLIDEVSRGGSVIKKDVVCSRLP